MLESEFQKKFIERAETRLKRFNPDFLKVESMHYRSFPDWVVLGPNVWAVLEMKKRKNSSRQPNQDYHVDRLNEKGFAIFVSPENEKEALDELEKLFSSWE